jgi:lathosterol oxidase
VFTNEQIIVLSIVASTGYVMALFWCLAARCNAEFCKKRIYDIPFPAGQLRREIINSLHTPIHAVLLAALLAIGLFDSFGTLPFLWSLALTAIWAEIWHYASHRAFHLDALHWIHAEHHKSRISTPFTAISFSFTEKFIFSLGILSFMAILDSTIGINFFGVAAWYVAYLLINSYGHANFEIRSGKFLNVLGKHLTSTTYHSLHHSRYNTNFGLGTRFLDRAFGTEATDYENLYRRVTVDRMPLTALSETVTPRA